MFAVEFDCFNNEALWIASVLRVEGRSVGRRSRAPSNLAVLNMGSIEKLFPVGMG